MSDAKNKILDDLTGLATGLGIAAQGVRDEVEQAVRARVDAILSENGMVSREEFEAVRAMAVAAREENAALRCSWIKFAGRFLAFYRLSESDNLIDNSRCPQIIKAGAYRRGQFDEFSRTTGTY
jgi:BMFP domain-containing protein YqiC